MPSGFGGGESGPCHDKTHESTAACSIATYYMRDSIQDVIDRDPDGNGICALGWSALYRLKDLQGAGTRLSSLSIPTKKGLYCSCFAGSERLGIVVVRNVSDNSHGTTSIGWTTGLRPTNRFQGQLTELPRITRNNVCIDEKGFMHIVAANSNTILYSRDGGTTFRRDDFPDRAVGGTIGRGARRLRCKRSR